MINCTLAAALAALSLAVTPAALQAQDKPDAKPAAAPAPAPDYKPNSATKTFTGTFGTRSMRYSAPVADQVLQDDKGVAKAAIVTPAYIPEPHDPHPPLPLRFNGGPGAA